jgi:hypothetical protein
MPAYLLRKSLGSYPSFARRELIKSGPQKIATDLIGQFEIGCSAGIDQPYAGFEASNFNLYHYY